MSEKHYPYIGGSFDRIVFDGDGSVWVPERENAKLRELLIDVSEEVPWSFMDTTKYYMPLRADKLRKLLCRMRELGIDVDE